MGILQTSGHAFKARLTQPQLWLLTLANRKDGELGTDELRAADGAENFSRAVLCYSIGSLEKRGLLATRSLERRDSRIRITAKGKRLAKEIGIR